MPPRPALPLWAGRTLALLGILLVALNLRTAVTALSPIAAQISSDIPLDNVGLSVIGTLPPIAFAVAGIFGAPIARKLGLERFLILAAVAMVVGHLLRALAAGYPVLFLGSVLAFTGMGVGNVLLPPLVKRYFPDRIGVVTAAYVTILTIGASSPAVLAAPAAHAAGWRVSIGVWALVAFLGLLPWIGVVLQNRRKRATPDAGSDALVVPPTRMVQGIWHSRTAWVVAIVFSVTSFNAYSMFAWMPDILITTAGQTPVQAGALLGYYSALGIPFALLAPVLAARMKNIGLIIELGAVCLVVGNLGLMLAPAAAPWLWVTIVGCGQVIFPVCLVLINLRARTHIGSVTLSGFSQGVSYTIAATGPLMIGLLFHWTGSWTGGFVLLLISAVVVAVGGHLLRKPRFVEDDLQKRGAAATR
ncbi:MFS transporter [Parafrigoribacterium mesophilum]|uniref:MFS transporter n=1 Tax=Parafrigoribacterium mesophilum TaxID=433646 RepID=UPI0031FD056D